MSSACLGSTDRHLSLAMAGGLFRGDAITKVSISVYTARKSPRLFLINFGLSGRFIFINFELEWFKKFTPNNQRNSTPICGFTLAFFLLIEAAGFELRNVRGRYNILNDILRLFKFLKYLLPLCQPKEERTNKLLQHICPKYTHS